MGVFSEDIDIARQLLRERGEDPDHYNFTMARNISDVYFSSNANVISKVTVSHGNGIRQDYELADEHAEWVPRFRHDLENNRFRQEPEPVR